MNDKFRFWDTVKKEFYRPVYEKKLKGRIEELLLTQAGEIMSRVTDGDQTTITHESQMSVRPHYIKNSYSGVKDKHDKKYYFNDIVCFIDDKGRKSWGVLIWDGDKLAIGSGPINNYTAIDQVTEQELRASEHAGNIYQNYSIIMGKEYQLEYFEHDHIPTIFKQKL